MTKHGVMSLTTGKVLTGTQQAVSLHRRNATEDKNRMTEICVMSSMAEMHAARNIMLTISILSESEQKCSSSPLILKLALLYFLWVLGMVNMTNMVGVRAPAMMVDSRYLTKRRRILALTEPRCRPCGASVRPSDCLGLLLMMPLIVV
jgi:hypothetical protein